MWHGRRERQLRDFSEAAITLEDQELALYQLRFFLFS
jgi:hypothetical protein